MPYSVLYRPAAPSAGRGAIRTCQLLGALEAMHDADALHRDVKPADVLLRRDGRAVLH